MLSIIGTLIGLLGSFLPEWLKFLKVKEDHKHELNILNVQAEMAKQQHMYRMEEIQVNADVASEQAVYKQAEQKYTGVKWIDGILALYSGTIRPTITYLFMGGYLLVKYAQFQVITATPGTDVWNVIWKLWNSEDMAAFMTVMGFWFGGRLLKSNLSIFGVGKTNGNGNGHYHVQPILPPPTPRKPDAPTDDPTGPKPPQDF